MSRRLLHLSYQKMSFVTHRIGRRCMQHGLCAKSGEIWWMQLIKFHSDILNRSYVFDLRSYMKHTCHDAYSSVALGSHLLPWMFFLHLSETIHQKQKSPDRYQYATTIYLCVGPRGCLFAMHQGGICFGNEKDTMRLFNKRLCDINRFYRSLRIST